MLGRHPEVDWAAISAAGNIYATSMTRLMKGCSGTRFSAICLYYFHRGRRVGKIVVPARNSVGPGLPARRTLGVRLSEKRAAVCHHVVPQVQLIVAQCN